MVYKLQGKLFDFSEPKLMAILNVSPESFYDQKVADSIDLLLKLANKQIEEGVDILDLGAVSSKPFAPQISAEEEWKRLKEPLLQLSKSFPNTIISIDTTRAEIANKVLDQGAHIINDVSQLHDPLMMDAIKPFDCAYILMHTQGEPSIMQVNPQYKNITSDIIEQLVKQVNNIREEGFDQLIIDPGFGFGKTLDHNYQLLKELKSFTFLKAPILVGLSRKSMLYKLLKIEPDKALNATTAAHMISLMNGAKILRVHDVKEAKETIEIFKAYQGN